MTVIAPFTLSTSDLKTLGQDRAVDFYRRLLWAEATRVGVGRNLIDVPDCINVGDGGIDAFVEDANPVSDEVFPIGTSGVQIKSSDLAPSECREELHEKGKCSEPIKPEVKRLLDKGGTYVLALFADITAPKRQRRVEAVRSELKSLGYPNAEVRVYSANQLAGFAERFPALVASIKGDILQCQCFPSWADRSDIRTPRAFVCDDERERYIAALRDELRTRTDRCPVLRVTGLPGIGKTRLVFEALAQDDLKNRVIYVAADEFQSSSLRARLESDENSSAIIVIDECDLQQHEQFVRSFSTRGNRLAVITLSHEVGQVPPPTLQLNLGALSSDRIEEIIRAEAPGLPGDIVSRLGRFADGYPRIAVLLVDSYNQSTAATDEFLRINDDALMNRLIGGKTDIGSDYFRRTKRVLRGVSLFQKLGYVDDLSAEAKWLADYLGVAWPDFSEIMGEQKRRGIVQGQYYIYVTPFMLRVHLIREWWQNQGFTPDSFNKFVVGIPEGIRRDLILRFLHHIPFVTTAERGREFAQAALGDEGFFSDGSILKSEVGADFFLKLAEADPASALGCLLRTVGTWNKDELLQFTSGRRQVIWALEKVAVWRDLFADAARLLLMLGEAENESWSNNASGVFSSLFAVGPGPVANTEASPKERFPILKAALESDAKEQRLLALHACDRALRSYGFRRTIGPEHQGVRREFKLWAPATYGELFDAYRQVWRLVRGRLRFMPMDEREQAASLLISNARGLGRIQNLADMVVDTLSELAQESSASQKAVLKGVIEILRYEGDTLAVETKNRWEQLRDELTGGDFPSLMRRFVGMSLLEDQFDEKGEPADQIQPRIEQLAQQAIEDAKILPPELPWLVTTDADNGFRFGYELGRRDKGFSYLSLVLEAQAKAGDTASMFFLGGYFRAVFEKDQPEWERQLDLLAEDGRTRRWVTELTWRSGMTDRASQRILNLARNGVVTAAGLHMFAYGGAVRNMSDQFFVGWIEFLLDREDALAASVAIDLYCFYYVYDKRDKILPEQLTVDLLTDGSWYRKVEPGARSQSVAYHWAHVAKAFIRLYPARSIELADIILEHLGEDGTIFHTPSSDVRAVVEEIAQQNPQQVWDLVARYLGPPIDSRAFEIKGWLRGGHFATEHEGALRIFPLEEIWAWVDEGVNERAWYLASFAPNKLFRAEAKTCIAREVLVRYGEREDVRRELMANFSTGMWWGLASEHFLASKRELLEFKSGEENINVRRWIDEYVSRLDREIRRERIQEEREDR